MLKSIVHLVVLSYLVCLMQARPSYLPPAEIVPSYEHVEYAPTVVGHTVHSIPTAVSHQSQTIVHEKRPYLRPIVKPILKTYHAPTVALPLTYSAYDYSPLSYSGLYDYGWSPSVGSVYGGWNAWPLK